jgi:hypothetical protein
MTAPLCLSTFKVFTASQFTGDQFTRLVDPLHNGNPQLSPDYRVQLCVIVRSVKASGPCEHSVLWTGRSRVRR